MTMRLLVAFFCMELVFAGSLCRAQDNPDGRDKIAAEIAASRALLEDLRPQADHLKPRVDAYLEYRQLLDGPKKTMQDARDEYWQYVGEHKAWSVLCGAFRRGGVLTAPFRSTSSIPELESVDARFNEAKDTLARNRAAIPGMLAADERFGGVKYGFDDFFEKGRMWEERYNDTVRRIGELEEEIEALERKLQRAEGQPTETAALIGLWKVPGTASAIEIKRTGAGELVGWMARGHLERFSEGQVIWTGFAQSTPDSPEYTATETDRQKRTKRIVLRIGDADTLIYDGKTHLSRIR